MKPQVVIDLQLIPRPCRVSVPQEWGVWVLLATTGVGPGGTWGTAGTAQRSWALREGSAGGRSSGLGHQQPFLGGWLQLPPHRAVLSLPDNPRRNSAKEFLVFSS